MFVFRKIIVKSIICLCDGVLNGKNICYNLDI